MSKPIWDAAGVNKALADSGYSTVLGSPDPRITTHSIPGVDGMAVGLHGVGPRTISGRGFLADAADAAAATAILNVKEDLRELHALVGEGVYSFTDTDGKVYTYCVLLAVQAVGPAVAHVEGATGYVGRIPVAFSILQQEATDP